MVTLTEAAANYIKGLMKNKHNMSFRLSIKQTGCSGYSYVPAIVEQHSETDIEINTEQGVKVYLDAEYIDMLKGTVIDFVSKGLGQHQLTFLNPNAKGECGCGESFTV